MNTPTENDAKRNFKDYEELENMKAEYLKHCFESAKKELVNDETVDGQDFLNAL